MPMVEGPKYSKVSSPRTVFRSTSPNTVHATIRPGEVRPGEVRPGEVRPGEVRLYCRMCFTPLIPEKHTLLQSCEMFPIGHRFSPLHLPQIEQAIEFYLAMGIKTNLPHVVVGQLRRPWSAPAAG